MRRYGLYLESGPKRRTTMVHVLDLLGCIANGPTTDAAMEATPGAINAYRRFLAAHGETIKADEPFEVRVVEHITEGDWLGNGSPYLVFPPDLQPLTPVEAKRYLQRFAFLSEALAAWAETQSGRALDAKPRAGGRTARAVLLHALGSPGAYLSSALGGAPGFSRLATSAERGETPLPEAFRQVADMASSLVSSTTPQQRAAVRALSGGERRYTLRKAVRRMLEHHWEHLAELSRRPGGPGLV
ncbi:MAG: hypothetical protein JOZ46_00635 [Candidatus Dormibacteraeota bacterium]|nr:hypothetical protein [Candidatus Dormibacteraeota bacterium]MBV9524299.1 hypothetical protein [Candidatus Dormibacteraeota bacterium]